MRPLADLLRLIRFPFMTTTTGDVLVGFLAVGLVPPSWRLVAPALDEIALLCVSSACLYAFGMVTNDIFDRERDRAIHPERPLPSGRIGPDTAWITAGVTLAVALGLAARYGLLSLATAGVLSVAILGYNSILKRFALPGSLLMGSIRGLNVLYGWTVLQSIHHGLSHADLFPPAIVFGYVTLITLLSTAEEGEDRWRAVVSLGAVALLLAAEQLRSPEMLPGPLILLLGITGWRLIVSRKDTSRAAIGRTVGHLLMGLYLLDAHFLIKGGHDYPGILVLGLSLPAILLSRLLRVSS